MSTDCTVLLAAPFSAPFRASLGMQHAFLGPLPGPLDDALRALPAATRASIRALVTFGTIRIDAALLAQLPALGLLCCGGSGFEGVDRAAAAARGVAVTHSPGANAASVADVALGLLIASVRGFTAGSDLVRRGGWSSAGIPLMRGLTGRRVGIYGLGAIGTRIAHRVAACEALVGYHNRTPRRDAPYEYFTTLTGLAQWADVLIVAVRADAGTRHSVDERILGALGPRGHVVNISRGSVIDETALIAALRDGRIEGAGLDVFEAEPDVPAALRELANVVLTPHLGGGTEEAQAAMGALVRRNLDAFFAGAALPTPVPPA